MCDGIAEGGRARPLTSLPEGFADEIGLLGIYQHLVLATFRHMLSFASSSTLSFAAPSTLARGGVAAGSRARPVFLNENEMEPDGGWGVDNLMDMMDTADVVCACSWHDAA